MNNLHNIKLLVLFVGFILIVSLACSSSTSTTSSTQPPLSEGQTQVGGLTSTPKSTNPPEATKTSEPTVTPTPLPIGMSRDNPYPSSSVVSAPNWEIKVIESKRGDEAWKEIQAANSFNEAAPDGMEYFLVKLHVKSTYSDSDEHSIGGCDFDVTGDRLTKYTCSMASVVPPDPQLDARLFTGGETEGWAGFLVGKGEGDLLLIFDESMNFDNDAIRYIALDDGAKISISPDLVGIKPTDLGKDKENPASLTDEVITEDWQISVVDFKRGEEAWKMANKANQFNDPPADGMEYIVFRIKARYIGTSDNGEKIDVSSFDTTGSKSVLYDLPSVVAPDPQLDTNLYPGGEAVGWVVLQVAKNETGVILIFNPVFDFGGNNKRYISLGS
jgi:hypothetical protein